MLNAISPVQSQNLSEMSRLADYFVVVGYDHGKEREGRSNGTIVQRFPEKDWQDTPFIDGIEWFCQPQGWALSTERQEPRFFVSILTDIDANRHYCACLCFNETISIVPSKPVDDDDDNDNNDREQEPIDGDSSSGGGGGGGGGGNRTLVRAMPTINHHHHHHHHSIIMYAPKCLVLVSRLDYIETFRNCLGIIYTVYVENLGIPLETLVGNILGCIQVPPAGGPQVRFSIGAGDRQALQPSISPSLPITQTSVNLLFQQLGIRNVLVLFCAVMTEHKILFHSVSYSRLTEGCRALTALMYPFRYTHVYIPLLPAALVEVLSTPTPFIMGVHSSLKHEVSELMDVIVVDLDGGSITVPDGISLALLPEPLLSQTQDHLSLVLQPELNCADYAFPPLAAIRAAATPNSSSMLDKELRAVFMRAFAQLLQGYRSCLTIIRIHPKPVITFHKAGFLGERCLTDCDFTIRVLDCMFFTSFVAERGPPWRVCDVWDELYSNMSDQLKQESQDHRLILIHIQELAQQLYTNENPNPQPYVQKILKPPDGAYARIHQPQLPIINNEQVQAIIDEGLAKNNLKVRLSALRPLQPRIVPSGLHISIVHDTRHLVSNSARRLEVLRNCINCIFENKISDARKTFPAVLRALKSKAARLALCMEFSQHVVGNKAMLEHQQFDLVVRLMNCALQDEHSSMDEHGVAAALLPLATAFCRKLCTGVIQFAYTCIQEHAVWQNQQFWEDAFYQDVQKDIKRLYYCSDTSRCDNFKSFNNDGVAAAVSPISPRGGGGGGSIYQNQQEPSALEIAAEQMRLWPTIDIEKQKELVTSEESTLYSQTIHYANRMVYLLVPLDIVGSKKTHRQGYNVYDAADTERASTSITNSDVFVPPRNSMASGGDSGGDAESGFEETAAAATDPAGETGNNVIRMVSRFVDRVCTEGGVSTEHVRCLHQMVPGVVHMHIETLEAVHRESKTLPPIQKPKILIPNMLPGEEMIMDGLRVYLLPDGREESTAGGLLPKTPPLLPAEGAIFLTNYRIVFKGLPCDPLACEQMVVCAFPITSLTKEKRISVQPQTRYEQCMQEGLQLRSSTFQLMKLAFDEEVSAERIDTLRKLIIKARYPPHIFHHFAFNGQIVVTSNAANAKGKEKTATLKGFAKKTLLKTARKAGFKPKQSSKRQKYVLPNMNMNINNMSVNLSSAAAADNNKYLTSPGRMSLPPVISSCNSDNNDLSHDDDHLSIDEFDITGFTSQQPPPPPSSALTDAKTLERLSERSYVRDWSRLGLNPSGGGGSSGGGYHHNNRRNEPFRITSVNCAYMICKSYPALLVVPSSVTDESIRRLCRLYRHSRFPVVTWRHPRTKALLIRGAGCHGKGVMGIRLKAHPSSASNLKTTSSESTSTLEQEKYIMSLVSATPLSSVSSLGQGSAVWGMSDSSLSIDSLLLSAAAAAAAAAAGDDRNHNVTPEQTRRNPFNKAIVGGGTLVSSTTTTTTTTTTTGKGIKNFGRWGSLKDKRHNSQASLASAVNQRGGGGGGGGGTVRHSADSDSGTECVYTFQRASLYILGEKKTMNMKGIMKTESIPKTDFIPVEYFDIRHTKTSFKKLMRACMPSSQNIEPDQSFYKLIESSEWLQQLQNLMQLAGAVIDLMDVQGSSVSICLEDGWDTTTTVCSVAQVCLDPHYRTIDGFRTLIEKEWLAFGYRFGHRSNLSANSQVTTFTPTFLQFLDIIHQIQNQFPLAFEFNDYYLKFLAYHTVSCRFRTFLLDCEFDRVECGIAAIEDKRGSLTSHHKGVDTSGGGGGGGGGVSDDEIVYPGGGGGGGGRLAIGNNTAGSNLGQSIFDYIEKQHTRSPIFYNFMYTPNYSEHPILRPLSHISSLDIWQYYLEEELAHGPSYDLEVLQQDIQQEEETEAADGTIIKSNRKIVTQGYDSVSVMVVPSQFSYLLEEIHKLETELGHLPQKWKVLWDKLELPNTDSLTRHASFSTALVRYHGKLIHKRSTLELLLKGKLASGMGIGNNVSSGGGGGGGAGNNNESNAYAHPHRFERLDTATPTHCDACSGVLWGPVKAGLRCVDCGHICHDKCADAVPKNCTKYKAVSNNIQSHTLTRSGGGGGGGGGGDNGSINSSSTMQTSSQQYYEQFSSNVAENRTHEGYLYKRGALLKGWKQRWFVLDSIKHQLRYYDAMEDSHCKGYIDLAEVVSVLPATPTPGPPKKTDDKSFFDLRTNKRTYNFCASDALTAQEWIEKVQACLQ